MKFRYRSSIFAVSLLFLVATVSHSETTATNRLALLIGVHIKFLAAGNGVS